MASPRIFVSSTCYDLNIVRGQLRSFLLNMGYEPVMSEYSDVLYDPSLHTHTSCLKELPNCDLAILIIGSRFGGKAVPEALEDVDFERIKKSSFSVKVLSEKEKLSVTQLEILKAIECNLPVFPFVDSNIYHDHNVYEKNKSKSIISEISFPSIDKPETAKYIFEFINFLRHRIRGNSVMPFAKMEDIEDHLRKQWAGLFQRLLTEQRQRRIESRQINYMANQFESLKAAILTTVGNSETREIARGVVRYRRLIDFLRSMPFPDYSVIFNSKTQWLDLLSKEIGIVEIIDAPDSNRFGRSLFIKEDRTFFESRFSPNILSDLSADWSAFTDMKEENRKIIFEAVGEMRGIAMRHVRYVDKPVDVVFRQPDEDNEQIEIFENESD